MGTYYWSVTGQLDEASKWLYKAHTMDPQNPSAVSLLAYLNWDLEDDDQAACWAQHAEAMAPESYIANNAMLMLNRISGDATQALAYARKAVQIESRDNYPDALAGLRDHDIQAGNFADARNRYEQSYPELFQAEPHIGQ